MRFQCKHCAGIVDIDDSDMGMAVACGHCENAVIVPDNRFATYAVIGDFVINRELGKGGMGVVYLAHQLSLNRPAALKVLNPELALDTSYVEQFTKEARTAARINHSSIVQAYAVGEEDGVYYFAMEYIEGSTLREILNHSGKLVVDKSLRIAADLSLALDYAWKKFGLVHGDIKPENIILTETGGTKLADLGLAHFNTDALEINNGSGIYGTPQYISPEQLLKHEPDNRSDIYSLGATLYYTLCGEYPYDGASPSSIVRKHLSEPLIPLHEREPSIPENLSKVIDKMLAKRPEHRYQSAEEVNRDIGLLIDGEEPLCEVCAESQKPLLVDHSKGLGKGSDVAGTSTEQGKKKSGKKGKKKLKIKSKKRGKVGLPAESQEVDGNDGVINLSVAEQVIDDNSMAETLVEFVEEKPKSNLRPTMKGSTKIALLAGFAMLMLVLAIVGYYQFYHIGDLSKGDPFEKDFNKATKQIVVYLHNRRVDDKAEDMVNKYFKMFPDANKFSSSVWELIADKHEEELQKLRIAPHKGDLVVWKEEGADLREELRLAQEREEQRKKEELARSLREKEAARQREIREAAMRKLKEKRNRIRWQAVTFARKNKYADVKNCLSELIHSKDAKTQKWAREKLDTARKAEELFNMFYNSGAKFKGMTLPVPLRVSKGKGGNPKIVRIDRETVYLQFSTLVFVNKQEHIKVLGKMEIKLENLNPPQVQKLCVEYFRRANDTYSNVSEYMYSYWICRGQYLFSTIQILSNPNASLLKIKNIKQLISQAKEILPISEDVDWKELKIKLKHYVNKEDKINIDNVLARMRAEFPHKYRAELRNIKKIVGVKTKKR